MTTDTRTSARPAPRAVRRAALHRHGHQQRRVVPPELRTLCRIVRHPAHRAVHAARGLALRHAAMAIRVRPVEHLQRVRHGRAHRGFVCGRCDHSFSLPAARAPDGGRQLRSDVCHHCARWHLPRRRVLLPATASRVDGGFHYRNIFIGTLQKQNGMPALAVSRVLRALRARRELPRRHVADAARLHPAVSRGGALRRAARRRPAA